MQFTLRTPSDKQFQEICQLISEFRLDNRELHAGQFIAAVGENELVGFGRLRRHADCTELCSLGVIASQRRKGIGKALVKELISRAAGNVYLVCIIPDFFRPFGFKIVADFPSAIKNKLGYCSSELAVPETYLQCCFRNNFSKALSTLISKADSLLRSNLDAANRS